MKLALIFAALGLVPLLILSALGYRSGVGAVERLLRERASARVSRVGRKVARTLKAQETRLTDLARDGALVNYLRDVRASDPASGSLAPAATATPAPAASRPPVAVSIAPTGVPTEVRSRFGEYLKANHDYVQSVVCVARSGRPLLRASLKGDEVVFQTDAISSNDARYEQRVWGLRETEPKALRMPVAGEAYGAALRVTVPVTVPVDSSYTVPPDGALVSEIRLGDVVRDADDPGAAGDAAGTPAERRRSLVALDNSTEEVVYNTNGAYSHTTASSMMPYFAEVTSRMRSGGEGFELYDAQDGARQLAAFGQIEGLDVSLAATEDYGAAVGPLKLVWLLGASAALVAGLAGLAFLLLIARRETHGIEEVARGASAIAAGQLDQRISVSRSGETRELAECFNAMSDKLREHIAREAESRQFQSFLRISAMVSHDLKNAIAGLSMLVTNMEKQFHREEFRADAIESLREATEKLKRTVARLSEPAKSLSGEYRIAARQTDLVPVMRRVLAINAEPTRPLYEIDARLPDMLVATVEPERVENVMENLVINALEAMASKGGGRLTVEAGTMPGDLVFFSVSDTGVGMSEEFIKTRLFRPFSTTKNKGIGLGLFTCREIVETHGGRLEVESSPNAGTRFRVVLPSRLFKSGERHTRPERVSAAASKAGPLAPE
jgi:signal transduction histidine kinase